MIGDLGLLGGKRKLSDDDRIGDDEDSDNDNDNSNKNNNGDLLSPNKINSKKKRFYI